jgi:hypothetical protein
MSVFEHGTSWCTSCQIAQNIEETRQFECEILEHGEYARAIASKL